MTIDIQHPYEFIPRNTQLTASVTGALTGADPHASRLHPHTVTAHALSTGDTKIQVAKDVILRQDGG
jgi:hypothetical protein